MNERHDSWSEPFRRDCRHFRHDRPCAPHKLEGKTCPECDRYEEAGGSVLVVKLAAAGDVLRTTALLPAIHRELGPLRVAWLTRPEAAPLLQGNPLVDEVLVTHHGEVPALLSARWFDHVLCPDADPEPAALAALAPARVRRGFVLSPGGQVEPLSPAAERWYRMGIRDDIKKANTRTYQDLAAETLGLPVPVADRPLLVLSGAEREEALRLREVLGLDPAMPLVGLNTGAGGRWEYKRWTLEHQRTFLQLMHEAGRAVLLLGGPEEVERHRLLLEGAAGLRVFDSGTRNTVRAFAARVGLCDVVVTGDTMALHVAVALERPVVALFGPTSAAEIHLYGAGAKLQPQGLECLVCYLPRCDRSPYCQELILPGDVAAAVEDLLARKP